MNKSPAFQFYPADFLSDENVELMDNRETGCYIRLLSRCWIEGSVPADITKIAKLCREDASAMADLWTAIKPCFIESEKQPGRLINPRLEDERQKQELYRTERSASGAKGAKTRWDKTLTNSVVDGKTIAKPSEEKGSAIAQPMANDSSSSPSSSSSSNKKTMSTDSIGSGEPIEPAEVPIAKSPQKPPRTKPPKLEPKFGEEARTLASALYDHLKEHGALPAAKDFFVRQALVAEELLKKHQLSEWIECLEWSLTEAYHRQKISNLRYLGDVAWPQYAKRNERGSQPIPRGIAGLQAAYEQALREETEEHDEG